MFVAHVFDNGRDLLRRRAFHVTPLAESVVEYPLRLLARLVVISRTASNVAQLCEWYQNGYMLSSACA